MKCFIEHLIGNLRTNKRVGKKLKWGNPDMTGVCMMIIILVRKKKTNNTAVGANFEKKGWEA